MKNFYVKGFLLSTMVLSIILKFNIGLIANDLDNSGDNFCYNANLPEEETMAFAVTCVTAPILICPSIHYGCPGTSTLPSVTGAPSASPGDVNCIQPTVTYTDYIITNTACLVEIHREWLAEYNDPNTNPWLYSECTQLILLEDNSGPSIHNCPSNITVSLDSNCDGFAYWTAPTATDNCGVASFTSNFASGHNFPLGTTTVVYTATDDCGNVSNCTFNVTVQGACCNDVPSITCPADMDGCVGMDTHPNYTGYPTTSVQTIGCPSPTLTYVDHVTQQGTCTGSVEIERVWTATNPSQTNLTATCTQMITVTDFFAPTINGCPADIVIEVPAGTNSTTVNWLAPTSYDNCNLASFVGSHQPGDVFNVGTTPVTYTSIDDCSNSSVCSFSVIVTVANCTNPPVITCPPNVVACAGSDSSPAVTGYATAVAGGTNCGTPIITYKDHLLIVGPCTGRVFIRRIWTATDPNDANLTSTCIQTINHRDANAPTISGCPSDVAIMLTGSAGCGTSVTWTAPTATDNCGLVSFVGSHASGDIFSEGITEVSYTATDICGNVSVCSFEINIQCLGCQAPPLITCPPMYVGCVGTDTEPATTGTATATAGSVFCGTPVISYSDYEHIVGPCAGRVIIHRTWTATDPDNPSLTASCMQKINLRDVDAPIINNNPADISMAVDGSNCSSIVSWTAPTAVDNCGLQSLTSNFNSGDVFPEGTTTVIYTAVDNCGNVSTASFDINIECLGCTVPPVIECPADYVGCPGDDYSPAALGYATAMSGSGTCQAPLLSYYDDIVSTGPCNGAIEIDRVWLATDPDKPKLFTGCVQLIRLEDSSQPSISNCPANITIQSDNNDCTAVANWTSPSSTDDCGIASFVASHSSGTSFDQGTTTVSYTATDNCGNVTTCSFTVTVECANCNTLPVLTCPANAVTCPGTDTSPNTFGNATAVAGGNFCGTPSISYQDVTIGTGSCYSIERTWTATDPGNSNMTISCMQTIEVTDNMAPTIANCPANIISNDPGAPIHWTVPTATDNCNVASMTSNFYPGHIFPVGITTVVYTATDDCGNSTNCSFEVTVVVPGCTVPPVITCPANVQLCPGSNYNPNNTGHATAAAGGSNCDDPIITFDDLIVSTGPCTTSKVIERTWTATDPGNSALVSSCIQTITLNDTTAPSISNCPANITISGAGNNCSMLVNWAAPTTYDNCQTVNLTSNISSGSYFAEGTTTVTYTATDMCGNIAQCSFTVTVTCSGCANPPNITCPADATVCPGAPYGPSYTGYASASSNGNYCGAPLITFSDVVVSNGPCAGQKLIERTWKATDPNNSNLSTTCVQMISKSDNVAPTITNCPSNITVSSTGGACSEVVTWNEPNYNDNCQTISLSSNYASGSVFNEGTTTVVYTATDACGNVSHCSFNVTVVCGSIDCPADITVPCDGNNGTYVTWDPPVYNGTCGDCVPGATIPGFIYMGQYNGHQYYCSLSPATYPSSQAICESYGGYLACIGGAGENNFLANILTIQSAWIGLSDANQEGTFTWECGEPLNYTNWYPGQPNNHNGNQDYCEMLSNGQWNDQYNHQALEFIMELPCNSVTQVAGPAPGSHLQAGTYEVTYHIQDNCGLSAYCSFDITVESSLSLTCVDDAVLTCPYNQNGMIVNWEQPLANSCCVSNCQGGQQISGFIYMGEYNGHHYYCSQYPDTWSSAQANCANNGGYLACVGDAGENSFLANLLTTQSAWIGLNDAAQEGSFVWECGEPYNYNNWYPGQPNNYGKNQDCVEMLSNGQWNDEYPTELNEYIMEIPGCLSITQIAGPPSGSFFDTNTTTTIKYQATDACGNVATCEFTVTIDPSACNSGGNSNLAWINEVQFGNMSNTSGNNGGYENFPNSCMNIEPSTTYSLYLEPGYGNVIKDVYWKVWIDFNMDGDFVDTGEYIAYGNGTTALSGMITMPSQIWNGETQMRIAMKCGAYPTGPCEAYDYGETEDYCVIISNAEVRDENTDQVSSRSNAEESATQLFGEQINRDVIAYPNPASDFVNLEINNAEGLIAIEIFNTYGKYIESIDLENYNKIDVSRLETGSYLINLMFDDGEQISKKIIVIE